MPILQGVHVVFAVALYEHAIRKRQRVFEGMHVVFAVALNEHAIRKRQRVLCRTDVCKNDEIFTWSPLKRTLRDIWCNCAGTWMCP